MSLSPVQQSLNDLIVRMEDSHDRRTCLWRGEHGARCDSRMAPHGQLGYCAQHELEACREIHAEEPTPETAEDLRLWEAMAYLETIAERLDATNAEVRQFGRRGVHLARYVELINLRRELTAQIQAMTSEQVAA